MRTIAFIAFVLSAAPALLASPAFGSRIERAPKAPTGEFTTASSDAVRLMNAFARCVADVRPRLAERLVELPFKGEEQDAATRKAIGGEQDCMGHVDGDLTFQPILLIGGMAEELYLKRFKASELAPLAASAAALEARNGYKEFARCVVHRNPSNVRALIVTTPASPQEAAVFGTMVADLGPCLPQGLTFRFGKPAMRSLFATALYRAAANANQLPTNSTTVQAGQN